MCFLLVCTTVNAAMETLISLANDVPGNDGVDLDLEKARELVEYDDTDDEDSEDYEYDDDDDDEIDGFHGATYPPDGLVSDVSVAESANAYSKSPLSFGSGVGLDEFSAPPKIKGLDMAIEMANQLDRDTFAEESVQQISAGLKAYRRTGDVNEMKKLGTLSGVAEMLLEVAAKEEEKKEEEEHKAAKVRYKPTHSRLPVYSATDDRLVGGMTSSSESSTPNNSEDEHGEQSDSPPPLVEGTIESDGPPPLLDCLPDSGGPPPLVEEMPRSGNVEGNPSDKKDRIQEVSSRQNINKSDGKAGLFFQNLVTDIATDGSSVDQVDSGQVLQNPMSHEGVSMKSKEPDNKELASVKQMKDDSIRNDFDKGRSNVGEAPEEDREKDHDKDISFQDDTEESEPSRTHSSGQEAVHFDNSIKTPTDDTASMPKRSSQLGAGAYEHGQRQSHTGATPLGKQLGGYLETGNPGVSIQEGAMVGTCIPFPTQPRIPGVESGNAPMNYPAGFSQGSKLLPGFSFPVGTFPVKNITPGLFPRMGPTEFSYFSKPACNQQSKPSPAPDFPQQTPQDFPGAFHIHGQEHRVDAFSYPFAADPLFGNFLGLPNPSPAFPPPQSVQEIEEALLSPEAPIAPTLMQEQFGSQKQWPQIRHTNIRRTQYPAPSPKQILPLPRGKVLCLMRGCPGSGKSTLAK